MTSLRKRVSSYFRQLSFHNEPREKRHSVNENSFVNKYLLGQIKLKDGPPVLYGKTPNDLPNFELGVYGTGAENIVGCATGPNGGLTTVKRIEKHLSITEDDIDYIDTQDETLEQTSLQPLRNNLDNTPMKIKVAGQIYLVTNTIKKNSNRKSRSLGSLQDLTLDTNVVSTNNNIENPSIDNKICDSHNTDTKVTETLSYPLSKSKSAGSAIDRKKKGKIKRLNERPGIQGQEQQQTTTTEQQQLPNIWNRKTDLVYGISDSLYDTNQVTKLKNGNPIADCFGIIARNDSAILALADGVNWGEKACIAAKSAIHGCLYYLNKTIFDDTSLFNFNETLLKENSPINTNFTSVETLENKITNTNEVFVALLRAFNTAHNLILENDGMLTTLTVAIVLPLKSTNYKKTDKNEKYICCVCNVGDTLAYIYSPTVGIREITKGSHDVNSNRDMRDALGALGPVDGINPELNNLTLSVTTLNPGDIVMIASDGLTDNYDPTVCKFTVNQNPNDANKQNKVSTTKETIIQPKEKAASRPPRPTKTSITPRATPSNVSRLAKDTLKSSKSLETKKPAHNNRHEPAVKSKSDSTTRNVDEPDLSSNPLVAQFMLNNAVDKPSQSNNTTNIAPNQQKNYRRVVSMVNPKTETNLSSDKENKTSKNLNPLAKSSSTSRVLKLSKTNSNLNQSQPSKMGFLRSKTSIDFSTQQLVRPVHINRNEDGLPFVSPIQKYELTLLLIEDILKRGITGRENPCLTAKILCENLVKYTISITAAKRHTLEDKDLYYDQKNEVLIEISAREKKIRRRRCLEKIQNLPGKLDHVSVVAYNVGNTVYSE